VKLRLIPLGTSAGRPTLARGASAFAVAAEGAWVLCDCGEGAQIAAQKAGLSLSRLDAVLITHLHGDHFNGLPGLLGTLGLEGRQRPLILAGPAGIADLLQHLARAGVTGERKQLAPQLTRQDHGRRPTVVVLRDSDRRARPLAAPSPQQGRHRPRAYERLVAQHHHRGLDLRPHRAQPNLNR